MSELTPLFQNVNMPSVLVTFFDHFCQLVYPPHCQVCLKNLNSRWPQTLVCPACRDQIISNRPPFCLKCSRTLKGRYPLCLICRRAHFHFDFAWAACHYSSPLKELIHQFKFEDKTYLRFLFADIMEEFTKIHRFDVQQFDYLIATPVSSVRLRERGFNQSLFLAQELSRRFQIPCLSKAVQKIRHTPSQSELSLKNRFTNLRGAFRMNPNLGVSKIFATFVPSEREGSSSIRNGRFLIIDDLLTTGSTASEMALTLKSAGARTVGVLTLAITV